MPVLAVTPEILRQGRETLDSTFRNIRAKDSRHGPPQPPLDELHGTTFTPDMVGDMGREPFGDDVVLHRPAGPGGQVACGRLRGQPSEARLSAGMVQAGPLHPLW